MKEILSEVAQYYSEKIKSHGPVPAGVDWNSVDSQTIRFDQLLKIIPAETQNFSLLDFGCGYGALYHHMKPRFGSFNYSGYDISVPMIEEARRLTKGEPVKLYTRVEEVGQQDYSIASGIFNVKQGTPDPEWKDYVLKTLSQLFSFSSKGFSFNMLTSYSDEGRKKDNLYYADPCWIFDYCKRNFSKEVALLHDYKIFEFTILVRR